MKFLILIKEKYIKIILSMEGILSSINRHDVVKTKKKLESVPTEEQIKLLKSKPWWNDNHNIGNKFLAQIIPGTHLVAHPSDATEIENLVMFESNVKIYFIDKNIIFKKMENSHCHDNVFLLLALKKLKSMQSGYALSKDGLWRHHSWGIDKNDKIVETTIERLVYVCSVELLAEK